MNRTTIEYVKAGLMALLALAMVAICVAARTLDAVSLAIMFGALTWYFALRARVFARAPRGGCGS